MAREKGGDWDGSTIIEDHITFLHDTRRMPSAAFVKARVPPETEISPAPQGDERVVFRLHFLRCFGLPATGFFRWFLDFNHLQPHHLKPNSVTLLPVLVTVCKGYIGILLTIELWGAFFYGKLGTSAKDTAAKCGGYVTVCRLAKRNAFPVIKLAQSVKMWQQSCFYVENVDPAADFLNLPPYKASPPTGLRPNWGYKPKLVSADTAAAIGRLRVLQESEGLVASDLLVAFVAPGPPAPEPPSSDLSDGRAP